MDQERVVLIAGGRRHQIPINDHAALHINHGFILTGLTLFRGTDKAISVGGLPKRQGIEIADAIESITGQPMKAQ